LACVLAAVQAIPLKRTMRPIIKSVNSNQRSTWRAGHNANFDGWASADVPQLLGAKLDPVAYATLPRTTWSAEAIAALPRSFDPRTHNATTANCNGPILDQGRCGSCWAFGATEAISDRLCLGKGTFLQLGPLDLTSCDNGDNGCNGGDPMSAWNYAQSSGLVTEACYPYLTTSGGPIPTCVPEPCLNFVATPSCTSQCVNGADWNGDKHYVSNVYAVQGEQQIQAEITNNGPVEAAFDVFQDFLAYKSGVYSHTSGSMLGGHAVKLMGYGTDPDGTDYWLCANSWTTAWGDGGYFRIRRGTDECGIEDGIVAGTVSS